MIRAYNQRFVIFLAGTLLGAFATLSVHAAPKSRVGAGAGDPQANRSKSTSGEKPESNRRSRKKATKAAGTALGSSQGQTPPECSVQLNLPEVLVAASGKNKYAQYLKTELERIAAQKKISVEKVTLDDLSTNDLARFQLMKQFHERRDQSYSFDSRTYAELKCMGASFGLGQALQAAHEYGPLIEFDNILSRVKAQLPKKPTATDVKKALEKTLSDRARKAGTRLRYNRDFYNVFDAIQGHRVQCNSATSLFFLIDRFVRGDQRQEGSPVVIYSTGHIQSGYANWEQGFNSSDSDIQVMEHTATDGALLPMGKASELVPGKNQFILERDYFMGEALNGFLVSSTFVQPDRCIANSSSVELGASQLVDQKFPEEESVDLALLHARGVRVSQGGAFGFGVSRQWPGDFSRGATLLNRNHGAADLMNLQSSLYNGRSGESFLGDDPAPSASGDDTPEDDDYDDVKATLADESKILVELAEDAAVIGTKKGMALKDVFSKYQMINSERPQGRVTDEVDNPNQVVPQSNISKFVQKAPTSFKDLEGMHGPRVEEMRREFFAEEKENAAKAAAEKAAVPEEKPKPAPSSQWIRASTATPAQAASFEKFIRENPRSLAILMDLSESQNDIYFETGADGKLKNVKIVAAYDYVEVPAEFLAELSSDWSDWMPRSGMQLASMKNRIYVGRAFSHSDRPTDDPVLREELQNFMDDIDVSTPMMADITYTEFKKILESRGVQVRVELKGKTAADRQKERFELFQSAFDPDTWRGSMGGDYAQRFELAQFAGVSASKEFVLKFDAYGGYETSYASGQDASENSNGGGGQVASPPSVRYSTTIDRFMSSALEDAADERNARFAESLRIWNFKKSTGVHLQFEPGVAELQQRDREPNNSPDPLVSVADIKRELKPDSPRVQEWLKKNPNGWAEVFRVDIDTKIDEPYWDKLTGVLVVPQKMKFWNPPSKTGAATPRPLSSGARIEKGVLTEESMDGLVPPSSSVPNSNP